MKVLLMGNPNVGKSVVFNRLTGANVISANYPGTTVEFTRGRMPIGEEKAEIIDVPGTYSLEATSPAEEVAVKMLDELSEEDIVVVVVDATNLERSLNLTLQILNKRKRTIVALNFWDETHHTGVHIDAEGLESILGVPCVPTVAITGIGAKTLVERMSEARPSKYLYDETQRWQKIGEIVKKVQKLTHRHHTFLDRLGEASVKPVSGIIIGLLVLAAVFEVIRFIGEGLISFVFDPIFENLWKPVLMQLSGLLGGVGFVHDVLIGKLQEGELHFTESMGLLSTGLYVPFAAVLPYVFSFYLVLSFLEDSGYLPRLAVLTDTIMHRIGLHGMGIIPMLLGLGCNVPGVLSSRIMENKRERFISATLMAISVPCMAQIAMIAGLAGEFGAKAFLPIFLTLLFVWVVLGLLMNRFMGGESPEILMDVPPYRIPYWKGIGKKVMMRIIWFVREAVPWVLFGVLIVNIMYATGIITFVARFCQPFVSGVLGLPGEAVGGLVIGFLRKDVAVGMLAPLGLNVRQVVVASVVLAMYFPCVATFAVMIKELGISGMMKAALIMITVTLIVGAGLNFLLQLLPGWG